MSCENDLTSADVEGSTSTSSHIASRLASGSTNSQNLYTFINHSLSFGLNLHETENLVKVLRPHHERNDRNDYLSNLDTEDALLLTVQFSEIVRIKQILLSVPPSGSERPCRCKVWVNRHDGLNLTDVDTVPPEMEFELLEGELGAIEYPVKIVKFSSVSSVTLALVGTDSSEAFKVWYVGFKGESRQYKGEKGEHLSVAAENMGDSMVDGLRDKFAPSQTTIR